VGVLELPRAHRQIQTILYRPTRRLSNRIGNIQFGRGLVRTSSDFGRREQVRLIQNYSITWRRVPLVRRSIQTIATPHHALGYLATVQQRVGGLRSSDPEKPPAVAYCHVAVLEFEPGWRPIMTRSGVLVLNEWRAHSVMIHNRRTSSGLYAYIDREDPCPRICPRQFS